MTQTEDLAKLVSASGFLFQVAVEEHVRRGEPEHGWRVLAREYPWGTTSGSRNGFIDFVAEKHRLRCVFECKRTQGGSWIFLVPAGAATTSSLRTFWTYLAADGMRGWGWDDLDFAPETYTSEFCIVRGAADDDRPMLERVASDIVRASESLAREEIQTRGWYEGTAGYLPAIVTNAKLYLCHVDPSQVNLATGVLPASAAFEEVSSVRFRKAMPSDIGHAAEAFDTIRDGALLRERSAFVVHAPHVNDWLASINELRRSPLDIRPYPWEKLSQSGRGGN